MPTNKLHNYIRFYRRQSGLNQTELSRILELHGDGSIRLYEAGKRLPPLSVAIGIAKVFSVSIENLFPGVCEKIGLDVKIRLRELEARLSETSGSAPRANTVAKILIWMNEQNS